MGGSLIFCQILTDIRTHVCMAYVASMALEAIGSHTHKGRKECRATPRPDFPPFKASKSGRMEERRREDAILQLVKVHEERTNDRLTGSINDPPLHALWQERAGRRENLRCTWEQGGGTKMKLS